MDGVGEWEWVLRRLIWFFDLHGVRYDEARCGTFDSEMV